MRLLDDSLLIAPTDLATFLQCRHKTGLDLAAAHGVLARPRYEDPFAQLLARRGEDHERQYVERLRAEGRQVVVIERRAGGPIGAALIRQTDDTLAAMRAGAEVIVQARLAAGPLAGYADLLVRVPQPSALGDWSYEPHDTKLARETRGSAILQLCAYAELLEAMQGTLPAHFAVVTPDPVEPVHRFRVADYLAYYRMVRTALETALPLGHDALRTEHYPEPVEHCAVCAWEARCVARRRADDHLSFVAGAARVHRQELTAQGYATLATAAAMPVPVAFKPARGARETYDRIGHQARVQHEQRVTGRPVVERLPVVPGEGLSRLPAPSPGDLFLDLEGARFAREGGREFLFGLWEPAGLTGGDARGEGGRGEGERGEGERGEGERGEGRYHAWWATTDAEERLAFEAVMDRIDRAWQADPGMHVYHYNHYEPAAFKRLVGRHITRGELLDRLLRAGRFVDLYPVVRQAVRCGVESYSLKPLEQYTGYTRQVALASVSQPLLAVELALESGAPEAIDEEIRAAVQGYNEDDCRSTEALRDWLERLRDEANADGETAERPVAADSAPSPAVSALQAEVEALRARLLERARQAGEETTDAAALRTLAYLIDWHRREENAAWWEYYRLRELPVEDLADERAAIAGLTFVERLGPVLGKTGKPTKSVRDRYAYPPQELEIGRKGTLHARDGQQFGTLVAHDRQRRLIDVEKGPSRAELHPSEVFACDVVQTAGVQRSVMRLAGRLLEADDARARIEAGGALEHEGAGPTPDEGRSGRAAGVPRVNGPGACGLALLFREPPRLRTGTFAPRQGETATDFAVRLVTDLDRTTLAIQGPPGSGKTYAGAQMIRALVRAGRRVGVTATSHKVIRNLLDEVARQAAEAGEAVRLGARASEGDETGEDGIRVYGGNPDARAAIGTEVDVFGGTAWFWSREECVGAVDVLFVDEAGQMSLANALAVAPAADSLVLLGDPQQLEQPEKASHPDGVGVSALQHVLGDAETMPDGQGIFLPVTYRMAPSITAFTSELFYDGQLAPAPGLERQVLSGTRFDGAGLWLVETPHEGNQTSAPEEVDAVEALVRELLGLDGDGGATGAGGVPLKASGGTAAGRAGDGADVASPGAPGAPRPTWIDARGVARPLTAADLRVVAPFNAQVNRLAERLLEMGVEVGTVDRFQGQTAVVVIYSMATSRPEDPPRGLEFLYSLHRLNVATSRARCAVFVVCAPRLLAPECRTPRQMRLANALCRFAELAGRARGLPL